ncbi:MAG: peroxidase family protein [Xanthomonadales bacterium]|nr:peroxidase family protein [Xanthomonadales bacterium]
MNQIAMTRRSTRRSRTFTVALLALVLLPPAMAAGQSDAQNDVSPALRLKRSPAEQLGPRPPQPPQDVRSIDGSGNNRIDLAMGQALRPLRRRFASDYADGVSTLAGASRPGPRAISNAVHAQLESVPNRAGLSDLFWQWGQFLDHDIDLTDGVDPPEPAPISVPRGDAYFDPQASGTQSITFNRSRYDLNTAPDRPREQTNEITGWIDASQVYGSNEDRANSLRSFVGGKLRSSAGDLLPTTTDDDPSASFAFVAGDVRVNEQLGLTAMHTLFMREHNWQAARLRQARPELDDEALYQAARAMVAAEIQAITYNEFLPRLLGNDALPPYAGYRPEVDARIVNSFSTAAFRLGHTLLSPALLRLDRQGREIEQGHLSLFDAFFAPTRLRDEGGIEPLLRGLAAQTCQELDPYVIDEVRNFLFGLPGSGGFDLASLNIQRGRDHGLPSYAALRRATGQPPARRFEDITGNADIRRRLASVYRRVDDVDAWTGLLSEPPRHGIVGDTLYQLLREQFVALRDGDRFWYERDLPPNQREEVRRTRLIDIIRRNTSIRSEMDDDPWRAG